MWRGVEQASRHALLFPSVSVSSSGTLKRFQLVHANVLGKDISWTILFPFTCDDHEKASTGVVVSSWAQLGIDCQLQHNRTIYGKDLRAQNSCTAK